MLNKPLSESESESAEGCQDWHILCQTVSQGTEEPSSGVLQLLRKGTSQPGLYQHHEMQSM